MSWTPAPPRLAEKLLAAALRHSEYRESVLGDLHEEYVARVAERGRRRPRAWYWREAMRLAHYGRQSPSYAGSRTYPEKQTRRPALHHV